MAESYLDADVERGELPDVYECYECGQLGLGCQCYTPTDWGKLSDGRCVTEEEWMAEKASEFGGVPGMIAPEPHKLKVHEEAGLMRRIDPMDAETDVTAQRAAEARREGRTTANPDGFAGGPQ